MVAAPRKTPDARTRLIGAVHAAKSRAGLDEDTYRTLLARITGKRSARDLSVQELNHVLDAINGRGPRRVAGTDQNTPADATGLRPARVKGPPRAGGQKLAPGAQAAKMRALWLSLYHLGAVQSPEEAALAAFVKRQTGYEVIEWLEPRQPHARVRPGSRRRVSRTIPRT